MGEVRLVEDTTGERERATWRARWAERSTWMRKVEQRRWWERSTLTRESNTEWEWEEKHARETAGKPMHLWSAYAKINEREQCGGEKSKQTRYSNKEGEKSTRGRQLENECTLIECLSKKKKVVP